MITGRIGIGLLLAVAATAACGVPLVSNAPLPANTSNTSRTSNANAGVNTNTIVVVNANTNTAPDVQSPPPVSDVGPGVHALVFTRPGAAVPVNYLLFLPAGSPAGGRWPVIFYLHGKSLSGDDPWMLTKYGLPKIVSRDAAFPFAVVAPQCRTGERWTDVETLDALLGEVLARQPVDPDRVYLTGFSMGAGGVWRLGGAKPERFAAVAALAGVEEQGSVRGLARVPVWAFHGTDDADVPASGSEAMVAALRAAGGDARLELIPGRDHNILDVYDRQDLYAWFLEHRRGR